MKFRTVLAAAAVALALTGCTGAGDQPTPPTVSAGGAPSAAPSEGAATPSASGEAASPSASTGASPSASPSPAQTATIPTDCRALIPADEYDETIGSTPLNHPEWIEPARAGAVEPIEPLPGSTSATILADSTRLRCAWRDPRADVTGLHVEIARVDPAVAKIHLDDRQVAGGYTCESVHGGRRCQLISQNELYPVEQAETLFTRDDIYVSVYQANFPTDDLIGDIVEAVWS